MLIFNNMMRSGYEEVKSYGPSWWPEYREMDAVYHLAGWTLDLMAYWLDQIVLNQFPEYCDEESLKAFENLLGIEYSWDPTEEERRRTVMAFYSGTGKLSRTTIMQLVKTYTGEDSNVFWKDGVLYITIAEDSDMTVQLELLLDLIAKRMPAHLLYKFNYNVVIEDDNSHVEQYDLINVNFRITVPFFGCYMLDGSWPLDGSILLDQKRGYGLVLAQGNRMEIHHENEAIEAAVITKNETCWFLDGEFLLDGSRELNSIYKKEDIE